ncbi:hypothetical protein FBU30_000926 [Linnemannia zychae]|nr:hypothetical protein FBU30_000926 [Linnemannia zychae]
MRSGTTFVILSCCIAMMAIRACSADPTPGSGNRPIKDTCTNFKLLEEEEPIVTATCKNDSGEEVETEIDLDKYLGNANGDFKWGSDSFWDSSELLDITGTIFSAELDTGDGHTFKPSSVDLSEKIVNRNGQLTYVP